MAARTSPPTCWRRTSGPFRRSRASIRSTIWSIWRFVTGRPVRALRMPASSLSRSQGSRDAVALAATHQPDVLDPLVGREPAAAGRALAPPADGPAGVGGAGVDHPVVVGTTPGTAHRHGATRCCGGANGSRGTTAPSTRRARRATCPGTSEPASTPLAARSPRRRPRGSRRRTSPLRDRPQGVAGTDHDDLLRGAAPALPRAGPRPPPAGSASTATRAVATMATVRRRRTYVRCMPLMVPERLFGVKARLEHMFALPRTRC